MSILLKTRKLFKFLESKNDTMSIEIIDKTLIIGDAFGEPIKKILLNNILEIKHGVASYFGHFETYWDVHTENEVVSFPTNSINVSDFTNHYKLSPIISFNENQTISVWKNK